MDEMADGPPFPPPLSAREAKALAIAARAESRRIRDALARRRRGAIEPPPGGTPPIRGENRALLEWCAATREASRQLVASAAAARRAAGERVCSVERRRGAGSLLPAGVDEDQLAARPVNRDGGR